YRDPLRAAFMHRVEAFLKRQPLVQDRIRIIDLAAAEAGQIAAEQWLEHQHERIALATLELLLKDVCADAHFLQERNRHTLCNFPLVAGAQPPAYKLSVARPTKRPRAPGADEIRFFLRGHQAPRLRLDRAAAGHRSH